ncbi:hypothetical protein PQ469_08160 [Mucilaginibacter sp. KACC 22773]|uniref:hypothetical protein n=1 Tax=Mucilaginibacter sp. KACC 22773 TaxID=3025671 RepID=UPI002367015E|nr:hypothetical protein [Mucilaginibacter sp. KACC 22773]WDF79977.1 hypothetical protein PQ469_08160 [Mucilaginibacter sp. KACC 22773]
MRYWFVFFLLINLSAKAQSVIKPDILRSDTTFSIQGENYSGYVFPAKNKVDIDAEQKGRFTPTIGDIKEAELALTHISKHPQIIDGKKLYGRKVLADVTPGFSNYKRQYVGYINVENQKVLLINILNFKNRTEAKEYFKNWEHHFIMGFDGFYEYNYTDFRFNLSTKKMEDN